MIRLWYRSLCSPWSNIYDTHTSIYGVEWLQEKGASPYSPMTCSATSDSLLPLDPCGSSSSLTCTTPGRPLEKGSVSTRAMGNITLVDSDGTRRMVMRLLSEARSVFEYLRQYQQCFYVQTMIIQFPKESSTAER